MIGINDIGNGLGTNEITANYSKILDFIQSETPDTQIFIQSVLPCNSDIMENNSRNANRTTQNIENLNKQLLNFENDNITYINLFDAFLDDNKQMDTVYTRDGVHLSKEGYELWISIISEYVG